LKNNLEIKVKESGMSKVEFAKKAKISLMSYYRYEKGERVPNIETAQRIAQALGVKVDDLYPVNDTA